MIFFLEGLFVDILENAIVIDVNGIGYKVIISSQVKNKLPAISQKVKLFTYFHVREDQQVLFGFLSLEDKQLFTKLISVSGVGPKVAMKMLSDLEPTHLCQAILNNDLAQLTQISGVGKKMAERLIIELKDKLHFSSTIPIQKDSLGTRQGITLEFKDDLILTLKTLGYHQEEIRRALNKSSSEMDHTMSLQHAIKVTLKHL